MVFSLNKVKGKGTELLVGMTPENDLEGQFCKLLAEVIMNGGRIVVHSNDGESVTARVASS